MHTDDQSLHLSLVNHVQKFCDIHDVFIQIFDCATKKLKQMLIVIQVENFCAMQKNFCGALRSVDKVLLV